MTFLAPQLSTILPESTWVTTLLRFLFYSIYFVCQVIKTHKTSGKVKVVLCHHRCKAATTWQLFALTVVNCSVCEMSKHSGKRKKIWQRYYWEYDSILVAKKNKSANLCSTRSAWFRCSWNFSRYQMQQDCGPLRHLEIVSEWELCPPHNRWWRFSFQPVDCLCW